MINYSLCHSKPSVLIYFAYFGINEQFQFYTQLSLALKLKAHIKTTEHESFSRFKIHVRTGDAKFKLTKTCPCNLQIFNKLKKIKKISSEKV